MSNFKHNFSELLLLANKNVTFTDSSSGFSFDLIPISVEDMFFDQDLSVLIGIFEKELSELAGTFDSKIDNYLTLLILLCSVGENRKEAKELAAIIQKALKKIVPEIVFDGAMFRIKNQILYPELLDEIIDIIFKILGRKRVVINKEDDEFTVAQKKAQLRAEKIRKSGKKKEEGNSIEDILLALIYEYPQYKLEDLFKLNVFTFNYLFSKVGQIANYEVSKIAAGNGLTKKHKYLIGKK